MSKLIAKEYLFMRFEIEINMIASGQDRADEGKATAAEVKRALLETAQDFDMEATVTETTE